MTLDRPLARPAPPRSSSLTGRPRVPLAALALLIGAAPFAMHAWAALNGYFWQDDFIITYRAAQASPFDPDYLFQAYNREHLAPGMLLLAWLVTWIAPLSYPVAVLPLLAMQALASVLFWRLLVRCFGPRPALLVPFAVFTASPLILLPTLWWAYGVQLIPLLLTMVGALGAHVRYLTGGRRRDAGYALLWTAAGMAFYEKAALLPALLLAVTILLAPPGERWALGWALRTHRRVWLSQLGLLAGYAAVYLSVSSPAVGAPGTGGGRYADLAGRLLLDTFLPGVFGGPLGAAGGGVSWHPPGLAVRILAAALAAGVVIGGLIVGGRRARHAWLLLAGYLAADLALVALTRLGLVGSLVGADPRYVADAVPVAVLFAAFAYLRPLESLPEPTHRPRPRLRTVLMTVLVVAFAANATVSHLRLAPAAQAAHAKRYVATAAAELSRTPGIVLYDGGVPVDILINWFGRDARASRVIGLLPGPPRFDLPAETMYQLDSTGRPRPIERLDDAVTDIPGTARDCGHLIDDRPTPVGLTAGVRGKLLARVEYFTGDGGPGWVTVAGRTIRVDFERGVHTLHIPVDGELDTLTFRRATPVAPVCVTKVIVGEPVV
ncbi:MAG TPA: hypothetical protein VGX25_32010 [Actinophytocola sp.]|uniref:hypothetical protein n=1 Tax=Actinophytocola sp. TaxID=1872138 RepID=UPI002DDDB5A5|nr:hypothetical protein [Actinophytocola sp.]HEV2784037.1 hypothetical protein [Actinophytocola sp.]